MPETTPTKVEELLKYSFLKNRLDEIRTNISLSPHNTVLWIGAGYSTNVCGLPTWRNFLEQCLGQINEHLPEYQIVKSIIGAGRLQLAAEYLHQLTGDELFTQIGKIFGGYGELKKELIISQYGCSKILTTNYDPVLENTMKYYSVKSPMDSIESLLSDDFSIIKLHGNATDPKSCVLTISNYAKTYNKDFDWYLINTFLTNTVIFIGASMEKSEPFFKSIRIIKRLNKVTKKHYAIVAVANDREGEELGKALENMGIYLIPYIPDAEHANLDEILNYLGACKLSKKQCKERISDVRKLTYEQKFVTAAVALNNICRNFEFEETFPDLEDVLNYYLTVMLKHPDWTKEVSNLRRNGFDPANFGRVAYGIKKVKKSVLEGMLIHFRTLSRLDGEIYQIDIANIKNRIRAMSPEK